VKGALRWPRCLDDLPITTNRYTEREDRKKKKERHERPYTGEWGEGW
jgi:hypothetical protein